MAATVTDLIRKYSDGSNYPNVASVSSPRSPGNTTLVCDDLTGWPTDTGVDFITFRLDTNNEVVSGSQTTWIAVKSGNSLINLTYVKGAVDTGNAINDRVMIVPSSDHADDLATAVLVHSNQDGTLKTSAVQAALNIASTPADYTPLATQPNSITYNGNRSYTAVFPDVNYTDRLSPGQRLRTTRTVAAPTQSASLNGTNQYFSKTSPAGMTSTDDFVVSALVKLSSYAAGHIMSRYNGTSGWYFGMNAGGQAYIYGHNASGANFRGATAYQSIPLNKWVHISAQLDMSTHTATTTTCYVMMDGVDVPVALDSGGTNPTALVQAGNLEVGSSNAGTNPFPGKIAQAAVFSAKVTQATMRGYISQGLTGTETSLISAYSFNGAITDLNTTNANNLTAQNGATATNADSPFGGQADGTISSTVDYGIIQKVSYSAPNTTVTVQVPEGCTIPTSGGISATSYSGVKAPYGFPAQRGKWRIEALIRARLNQSAPVTATWYNIGPTSGSAMGSPLVLNTGEYILGYEATLYTDRGAAGTVEAYSTLGTTSAAETDIDMTAFISGNNVTATSSNIKKEKPFTVDTTKSLYLNVKAGAAGVATVIVLNDYALAKIYAENAYL